MTFAVAPRRIGSAPVFPIGLGTMNLTHGYGHPPSAEAARRLIHRAIELGVTHLDCAALYGYGRSETLLGEVLPSVRSRIHLASKCGLTGIDGKRVLDGRPQTLKRTLEDSLTRLRTERIDLYYLHRWDKAVPIEESVGALSEMVRSGKVGAIGLCEVSAATLRRAHAVHPIVAVQSEYSLWTRNPEIAVLEECRRIGGAFVAFAPIARGFLGGALTDPAALEPGDLRLSMPRFQGDNWVANSALLPPLRRIASAAGCTPAQLALTWLLNKAPHIVAIPGTTSLAHLEENIAAAGIRPDARMLQEAEALIGRDTVCGSRYGAAAQADIDTEEFAADRPEARPHRATLEESARH